MREFEIINKLLKPLAGKDSGGLKDDCAFFDGYAVTKDMLVAGVHFFENDAPYNLARKALRVNLSDLAASGATPFGFMLALAIPKGTDEKWLAEFAKGLAVDSNEFNFQMLGGDTVFHDGALTISVTAIGKCKKPVTRSGAKEGDNIFVSGKIGGGYLGLKAKQENKQNEFIEKYELPNPRVDLVPLIQKYASACIDISDGLLADLNHICEESNVGAELFQNQIPLASTTADFMEQVSGGDDYELLFTSKEEKLENCHKIGKVLRNSHLLLDGKPVIARGFEHGRQGAPR